MKPLVFQVGDRVWRLADPEPTGRVIQVMANGLVTAHWPGGPATDHPSSLRHEADRPKTEPEPLRATPAQRRATTALYEHVTDIAKAGGASVELLAHQLARRALVAALADLDELARAADPQAFEEHPIEARSRSLVALQWSVRREIAHDHAKRIRARILGGTP